MALLAVSVQRTPRRLYGLSYMPLGGSILFSSMAAAGSGIVDERALPVRRDADAELAAHLRIKNALDAPQAGPSSDEPSAAGSANITCPEGSYWALLQDVWRSGLPVQADDRPDDWRGCTVCDVAFFTQGFVRAWYFTARDGTLRKKRMKNLGVQELVAAFGAGKSVGLEEEVVALGIFGPTGIMDAAGRVGSTVAPLERATLRWLLDRRDSSRRKQLHAVLRYVRPRGERESVLRFDWRAQVTSYELRSSMAPLKSASTASIVPAHVRLATHGDTNLLHSCKEKHVPTAAVREAAQVCATLAERVQPGVPRERVRVCADFKLLGGSKVVLLWAATPPPEAAFPSPEFPSSMPCASMPAEATQRVSRAAHVDAALLVPSARGRRATTPSTSVGVPGMPLGATVLGSGVAGGGGGGDDGGAPSTAALHPSGCALSLRPPSSSARRSGALADDADDVDAGGTRERTLDAPSLGDSLAVPLSRAASECHRLASDPLTTRRMPGASLRCSRYFVCRGCGRAEPRHLALQPERDVQSARAAGVMALTAAARRGGGAATAIGGADAAGGLPLDERARPATSQSARADHRPQSPRELALPSARPTSATLSAQARLASPRFVMRAHAGWHLAGMCHDCAARCAVANAAAEWRGNDMASSPPSSPRTKAEGATATTGRRGPGALKAMAARDLGSMRHLLLADGISTGGATAAPGDDSDAKSDAAPGPAEAAVVDATREDAAPAGPPTAEAEAPAGLAPTSAHQLKATPLWLQPYMRTSS